MARSATRNASSARPNTTAGPTTADGWLLHLASSSERGTGRALGPGLRSHRGGRTDHVPSRPTQACRRKRPTNCRKTIPANPFHPKRRASTAAAEPARVPVALRDAPAHAGAPSHRLYPLVPSRCEGQGPLEARRCGKVIAADGDAHAGAGNRQLAARLNPRRWPHTSSSRRTRSRRCLRKRPLHRTSARSRTCFVAPVPLLQLYSDGCPLAAPHLPPPRSILGCFVLLSACRRLG